MIKVGKITKKEIKEVDGISCMSCRQPAIYYINVGWEGDGETIDLCKKDFINLQKKIAKVKI